MKESAVASHIRLDAAQLGVNLWRNNTGAARIIDDNGIERFVRWGLCNESEKQNKTVKSSDWIGNTPTLVTAEMVGTLVGIFTAIEAKPEGWYLIPSDNRGAAQAAFHDIVRRGGGYAGFACSVEDFRRIVRR